MPFMSRAYLESMSTDMRCQFYATHAPLGFHPGTADDLMLPDSDRYAGVYVLGVQGVGKSGFLENLITFDAQVHNAVIVIDPHGDLTNHCLAVLPPHRLTQTYVLDMADEDCPFGVNMFAVEVQQGSLAQAHAVDRILHIFEVLWPDVLAQQHLPRYVRAATYTLLANPGATLVDMYEFLLDEQIRVRMLQHVTEPTVRQFWHAQYDALSAAERSRRVQPLIGRLEALFMGRSLVRNIVGQRRTTIDFRQAIAHKEIIFIHLPTKIVAEDARLIGTILLTQIHAAVFSFASVPEAKRPGLSLYIDEFQHFATADLAELFTEGRKFGVRLTVAHQYRGQLPSYLRQATMTARTKTCFQLTPEDSREMAHLFPSQEPVVQPDDIEVHPVRYLLTHPSNDPAVRQFTEAYLHPLQQQRHAGWVEIESRGLASNIAAIWNVGQTANPRVPDPTARLDNLLHEVMREGTWHMPIPLDIVKGFANCGRGFYKQAVNLGQDDPLLQWDAEFPKALVVRTADGASRWTRSPEDAWEQLYHLIFHMRLVMRRLCEGPIGKLTTTSPTEVANMLTQLPRRAAFVRSGETIGVIYTADTPKRATGDSLLARVKTVLQQTRQKYCHPRKEVEQNMEQLPVPSGLAVPRWEEI